MVIQARAEATRKRIIEAAVRLFTDLGYGDTGLADVMHRAEVSKGAFYYHFESEEALASAIIDEGVARLLDTFGGVTDSPSPALENTIRATFLLAHMTLTDELARVANQLRQALSQISGAGAKTYLYSAAAFLEQVEKAILKVTCARTSPTTRSPRQYAFACLAATCCQTPWATIHSPGWPGWTQRTQPSRCAFV